MQVVALFEAAAHLSQPRTQGAPVRAFAAAAFATQAMASSAMHAYMRAFMACLSVYTGANLLAACTRPCFSKVDPGSNARPTCCKQLRAQGANRVAERALRG